MGKIKFSEAGLIVDKPHVICAIKRLQRKGIPYHKIGKKYGVVVDGIIYPPKAVFEEAYRVATGLSIEGLYHGGQRTTNLALERLGFKIVHLN